MTFCYLFKSKTWQIMPMYALYISDKSISNIMNSLSHDFNILSEWFYNNFMVLNPDKCSFMLLGVDDELQTNLVCGNETLKNSKQEKVLGSLLTTNSISKRIYQILLKLLRLNLMH